MDFDLLSACEALAGNTIDDFDNITDQDIQRWQALFGMTPNEARVAIEDWRMDLSRTTISASAWEAVKQSWSAYDKEAYEYAMASGKLAAALSKPKPSSPSTGKYLLRLEPDTPTLDQIQHISGMPAPPVIYSGLDDDGERCDFCIVAGPTRDGIIEWLAANKAPHIRPTFIRYCQAAKDLDDNSRCPTLGIETTLPHFRMNDNDLPPTYASPRQHEYPVWYFFYGTLAQPDVLARLLQLDGAPELPVARIRGGRLTMWGGRYKALVPSAKRSATVDGWAYLVRTRAEEDALRTYETERYSVVRKEIEFLDPAGGAGVTRPGLTFMFEEEEEAEEAENCV